MSRARVPLTVLPTREAVDRHFAPAIFDEVTSADATREDLAIVVPPGPKALWSVVPALSVVLGFLRLRFSRR
jgi:hypothetical protein